MPNVNMKTTSICGDCGKIIDVKETIVSFEQFKEITGTIVEKPCPKHNKEFKQELKEKGESERPDVEIKKTK